MYPICVKMFSFFFWGGEGIFTKMQDLDPLLPSHENGQEN